MAVLSNLTEINYYWKSRWIEAEYLQSREAERWYSWTKKATLLRDWKKMISTESERKPLKKPFLIHGSIQGWKMCMWR